VAVTEVAEAEAHRVGLSGGPCCDICPVLESAHRTRPSTGTPTAMWRAKPRTILVHGEPASRLAPSPIATPVGGTVGWAQRSRPGALPGPGARSCPSGTSEVHEVVEDDESGWRDGNAGTVDLHEDVGLRER
jgi:hypothetical protein